MLTRLLLPFLALMPPALVAARLTQRSEPAPYHHHETAPLVPDRYIVVLHDGYTLQEHFNYISSNLSETSQRFYHLDIFNSYHALLDAPFVHNVIRNDQGVNYVEHEHYVRQEVHLERRKETAEAFWPSLRRRWQTLKVLRGYNVRMLTTWGKLQTPVTGGEVVSFLVADSCFTWLHQTNFIKGISSRGRYGRFCVCNGHGY